MISAGVVGRAVERYFDSTDAVVAAYKSTDEDLLASKLDLYFQRMRAMDKLWTDTACAPGAAERLAVGRAWLDAYMERSIFKRLEAMLQQLQDYAAVAVSAAAPRTQRYGRQRSLSPRAPVNHLYARFTCAVRDAGVRAAAGPFYVVPCPWLAGAQSVPC